MTDKLDIVRNAAAAMLAQQLEVRDLEERLEAAKRRFDYMQFEQLPDMMDSVGLDRIGLPATDNRPAADLVLKPYYRASIPVAWSPERQAEAFAALTELGHDHLIKTVIHISLLRGEHELVAKILTLLREHFNIHADVRESVHAATLTAWLRTQFEAHKPLPPLDVIGAVVGRIAQIRERKE